MSTLPPTTPPDVLPLASSAPVFTDLARDDVFRLETRRLWLRWPQMKDASALARHASDKAVAEMTARIPHPYPRDSVSHVLFDLRKGNALGEHMVLAIAPKLKPDEFMGLVGAHRNDRGTVTLGYWLGAEHWGNGYATEAAQAMIDATFTLSGTNRIEAAVRVINPASRHVLEKCGFRHEGSRLKPMPERGGLLPCDEFSLDRKTWIAFKNWHGGLAMPVRDHASVISPVATTSELRA